MFLHWANVLRQPGRGHGPSTLSLKASQRFVYRGLTERVIIVVFWITKATKADQNTTNTVHAYTLYDSSVVLGSYFFEDQLWLTSPGRAASRSQQRWKDVGSNMLAPHIYAELITRMCGEGRFSFAWRLCEDVCCLSRVSMKGACRHSRGMLVTARMGSRV